MDNNLDKYLSQSVISRIGNLLSHHRFTLLQSRDEEEHFLVSYSRNRDRVILYESRNRLDSPYIDVILGREGWCSFFNRAVTLHGLREAHLKTNCVFGAYSLLSVDSPADVDIVANRIISDLCTYAADFLAGDYATFNKEYSRNGAKYGNYFYYIWSLEEQ